MSRLTIVCRRPLKNISKETHNKGLKEGKEGAKNILLIILALDEEERGMFGLAQRMMKKKEKRKN